MSLSKASGVSTATLTKAKDMVIFGDKYKTKFGRLTQEGRGKRSYLRKEIADKNFGSFAGKRISKNTNRAKNALKSRNPGLAKAYKKEITRLVEIAKKGR